MLCCSCQQNTQNYKLSELDWLIGDWTRKDNNKFYSESWKKQSDQVYLAHGFVLKGPDTIMQEQIRLEQRDSGIFFIPIVKDQNDGKAVTFKLVSTKSGKFIFENKAHDFPQRIIYTQLQPDTLDAWVEGMINGNFRHISFKMVKK